MIHVLSQYVWPDRSPTAIYCEQLADGLLARGHEVVLVGGRGIYRDGVRPAPRTKVVQLEHRVAKRGDLPATVLEYATVTHAMNRYLDAHVRRGDTVIVGSFPPLTVYLSLAVRRKGARAIYWLQDYYPDLLRSLWDAPKPLRFALGQSWNLALRGWHGVMKAAGNLSYHGDNAVVLRNWPILDLGDEQPFEPGLATYIGNLGYAHCIPSFVAAAEKLRAEGFRVRVLGDGPGCARLPPWIEVKKVPESEEALRAAYWASEVHLVAGDPKIANALFPSKFWSALATGRRVVCTGFEGAMADELSASFASAHARHKGDMIAYVEREACG